MTNVTDPIGCFVCFPVDMTNSQRRERTKNNLNILDDMSNLPMRRPYIFYWVGDHKIIVFNLEMTNIVLDS